MKYQEELEGLNYNIKVFTWLQIICVVAIVMLFAYDGFAQINLFIASLGVVGIAAQGFIKKSTRKTIATNRKTKVSELCHVLSL